MSEWGAVGFYYDYEKKMRRDEVKNIKGLVIRKYKYPGIVGMILHAYSGIDYFLSHDTNNFYNFDGSNAENEYSDYEELKISFDAMMDVGAIASGGDSLKRTLADEELDVEKIDEDDLRRKLYGCEGSFGWLYITFTGNLEDGPKLKYAYEYGCGEDYEIGEIRRVYDIFKNNTSNQISEELEELMQTAIQFFEQNGELMTEDEFLDFEDKGTEWVKSYKKM